MATKKKASEDDIRRVKRQWSRGEKRLAVLKADELGVSAEDRPEGMDEFRRLMRRA